jgi:lipopolysaccharide/colanic/teichoic acid biosynthesis glycosyltransferase
MRSSILLFIDVALVIVATLSALLLHDNFEIRSDRAVELLPYVVATVALTLAVWPAAGLNRTVWRFSGLPDYLRLTGAMAATAVGAVAATFAYNRLEGVARSLPFLQFLAGTAFLMGVRVLHKLSYEIRQHRKASAAFLQLPDEVPLETVLIVGISRLTEVYLQAVAELTPHCVRIAGLIGRSDRHAGRLVATQPVLGVPENIAQILDNLAVHGIQVDRIVVTTAFKALSAKAQEALLSAERHRRIKIHFLAETMGLEFKQRQSQMRSDRRPHANLSFQIEADELSKLAKRRYWTVKRVTDYLASLCLLVTLSPLMLLSALAVAISLGSPVVFWQQRPGLGGRPFRLYKFRTMTAAYSSSGRKLQDRERASIAGNLLRRLRLDELPQLFNILRGDMSFVGPRPLLPRDQSEAYCARLMVRPGLTGWAQVAGGRDLTPEDKAALDVWYVRNSSLALDIEIALRTIPVVLFGERISIALVERAWRDLSEAGIIRGEISHKTENGLRIVDAHV